MSERPTTKSGNESPATRPASASPTLAEAWRGVWLIARREITTRLRSRAFIVLTAVLVLGVVAGAVIAGTSGSSSATTVGLTPQVTSLSQTITAVAKESGNTIDIRDVSSEQAGRSEVSDGSLDAVVTGSPQEMTVIVKKTADAGLVSVLNQVAQQSALASQITALGGDPAAVGQAVAGASVHVQSLEPQPELQSDQVFIGMITGILIFVALMMTGQLVAQGVVEEKTSRIIELLLATMRPWQVMTGKVAGLGLIGLAQLVLVAVAGLASAAAVGLLDSLSVSLGSAAIWLVVWFLIGYTTYAILMAALASLVSRQEDVGAVLTPVTVLMMVPYILGIVMLPTNPTSVLLEILSMVPLFSPLLMPTRIAVGLAQPWQIIVSLALAIAFIPVLIRIAGTIYARAVLRTGARVSIREVLANK